MDSDTFSSSVIMNGDTFFRMVTHTTRLNQFWLDAICDHIQHQFPDLHRHLHENNDEPLPMLGISLPGKTLDHNFYLKLSVFIDKEDKTEFDICLERHVVHGRPQVLIHRIVQDYEQASAVLHDLYLNATCCVEPRIISNIERRRERNRKSRARARLRKQAH